jgi:hypothetical protein
MPLDPQKTTCKTCGQSIIIHRGIRKFCNSRCRVLWHYRERIKLAGNPNALLENLVRQEAVLTARLEGIKTRISLLLRKL